MDDVNSWGGKAPGDQWDGMTSIGSLTDCVRGEPKNWILSQTVKQKVRLA